jgi:hypothetical protein
MRQGQQNRRSRGRNNNNNNNSNNGRKAQNPLTRNYESSGPDVKIRGTAAHIAEKYMALARDAASSGDSVMAENYLQHAEHYNRIIMAAQAQAAPPQQPYQGGDNGYVPNGQHRPQPEMLGPALRDQPQPMVAEPLILPGMEPQPVIADDISPMMPIPAPAPSQPAPTRDGDGGRRRRRRYPTAAGAPRPNGVSESSGTHNGSGNGLDGSGEGHSPDEVVAN